MGVVVSAIAAGLVHNIDKDFTIEEQTENEYHEIEKPIEVDKTIDGTKVEEKEKFLTPGFPSVTVSVSSQTNEEYLNAVEESKVDPIEDILKAAVEKREVFASTDTKIQDDIIPILKSERNCIDDEEENDKKLSFFRDFFSTLRISYPETENDIKSNTDDRLLLSPKHTVTFDDEVTEKTDDVRISNEDLHDNLKFPIINLLPKLTSELEAEQRKCDPAWFRKSYTNLATVQRVYLTHPRYTPVRRPASQRSLRRPVSRACSLLSTPTHYCKLGSARYQRQGTRSRTTSPVRRKDCLIMNNSWDKQDISLG